MHFIRLVKTATELEIESKYSSRWDVFVFLTLKFYNKSSEGSAWRRNVEKNADILYISRHVMELLS